MSGRTLRAVVTLIAALLATLLPVLPAAAHDGVLAASSPAPDGVVRQLQAIDLEFTSPVEPDLTTFTLRSADGTRTTLLPARYADQNTRVRLTWSTSLRPGLHRVGVQTVHTDGHPGAAYVQFELSPDGKRRAGAWPTTGAAEADPVSRQRVQTDAALPWVVGFGVALLALLTVFLARSQRSERSGPSR